MKGLIIKDFYSLKKQIEAFAFIITGVFGVAVMFALSESFGNLKTAVSEMAKDGLDITTVVKISVMLFLVLPLVCTGNIADLFTYDRTASFYKTAASMPLTAGKRVMSKFITSFIFLSIGAAVDIAMAAVMASVSDIIVFSKCAGVLFSISACMIIYMSIVITLCYGGVSAANATFIPIISFVALFVVIKLRDIGKVLFSDDIQSMASFFRSMVSALENRFYLFLAAAVPVCIICYIISVYFAEKRKEVA